MAGHLHTSMANKKLIFIGSRWIMPRLIASAHDYDIQGILDADHVGQTMFGLPVIGAESDCEQYADCVFHVATYWDGASQDVRQKRYKQIALIESTGLEVVTLIHPTATTTAGSIIGKGTYIDEICHVSNDCVIGPYCSMTTGTVIGHDTTLGFNCQISAQATLSMQTVGHNTSIGAYAKIMHWKNKDTRNRKIHIGSNCKIFSGVAMSKDIPNGHMQITNNRIWRSKEAPQDELC